MEVFGRISVVCRNLQLGGTGWSTIYQELREMLRRTKVDDQRRWIARANRRQYRPSCSRWVPVRIGPRVNNVDERLNAELNPEWTAAVRTACVPRGSALRYMRGGLDGTRFSSGFKVICWADVHVEGRSQ